MNKKQFIEFIMQAGVLKLGQFKLKSGRKSPYFFNSGLFNTGKQLSQLAEAYATRIFENKIKFDVIFGPAYKGIPLAATTAAHLSNNFNLDKHYAFNRKEAKTHGEGGTIVGQDLTKKKVLIIDDVITAGTAIKEAINTIKSNQAEPCGIIIALDRMEKGKNHLSAIQEIEQEYSIPVYNIISFNDIIEYLKQNQQQNQQQKFLHEMQIYRKEYGIV